MCTSLYYREKTEEELRWEQEYLDMGYGVTPSETVDDRSNDSSAPSDNKEDVMQPK